MDDSLITDAWGHLIGYGSETAKFFFWGLDEKGNIDPSDVNRNKAYIKKYNEIGGYYILSIEEIYKECPDSEQIDDLNSRSSTIYPIYLQIYNGITQAGINKKNLGSKKVPILLGNFAPFGKQQTNQANSEVEANWIKKNDRVRRERIVKLLMENSIEGFVFCFGDIDKNKDIFKKYCDFEDLNFNIPSNQKSTLYCKAREHNIFLFKHPSRGWVTTDQINEIISGLVIKYYELGI